MTKEEKNTIKIARENAVIGQAKFCEELMKRLVPDIMAVTTSSYYPNKTRAKDDIKRLRRELNELREQLNCLGW